MLGISFLSLLLFGLFIALAILIFVIKNVRKSNSKNAINGTIFLISSLAILTLLGAVASVLLKNSIPENIQALNFNKTVQTIGKVDSKAKTDSKAIANTSSNANNNGSKPFIAEAFDPNNSVKPKVIKDDFSGDITSITDADGTITQYGGDDFKYDFIVNPDKTAYGFYGYTGDEGNPGTANLYVFLPNGKTVQEGNGCTQYCFNYQAAIHLLQCKKGFQLNGQYKQMQAKLTAATAQ